MECRSKRMLWGASVGVLLMAPMAAAAQTQSDADKIAKLEQETQQLQRQLKQLQTEIAKTRQKAEKVEAAQAAAPASLAVPVALQKSGETAGADKKAVAADVGGSASLKDKTPAVPSLSAYGLTFYGTIDMGYAFTSNRAPATGSFYVGSDYTIYGSRYASRPISTITNNALEQSKVGLKIEENLFEGWAAIGRLETGFNPLSGEISDACASLLRNNGKTYGQMDTNGDGSRCGQAFNGAAWVGVTHPLYGTLTAGRQNSLVLDGMGVYDPMALSYAFSILGYTGTVGPGIGSTETARWDNSVKYLISYGPVHATAMFTSGGQETPMIGTGYAGNLGFTYGGFSLDGYYTKENGAVNLTFIPNPIYGGSVTCVSGATPQNDSNPKDWCPNYLLGTVTDNSAWDVMGKYTFLFGGGFKDEGPADKLTLFAGYQYADLSNPSSPQSAYNGFTTIGGYRFVTSGVQAFGTDRILQTEWAGARYQTGPWAITGAYYNWNQNSYINAALHNCAYVNSHPPVATNGIGRQIGSNCSGDYNQGSFLVDYVFNKYFDVYGGVSYTEIDGGLSSGFLRTDNTTFASGVRLKW